MASTFSAKQEKAIAILQQIKDAIVQLQEWNSDKDDAEDYFKSNEGIKDLAASCMLITAVGEGFKNVDKLTDFQLLSLKPEYPWREVKGIRDKIAHGYFDIDNNIIFEASKYDLPELIPAIDFFIEHLQNK